MEVLFVGVSSCVPEVGEETACCLINGKYLVDTGWCAAARLREFGVDPLAIEAVILTHLHQDHYLGLPQMLFYRGICGAQLAASRLRIIGPGQHLEEVVTSATAFLQTPRFPELRVELEIAGLRPGDRYEVDGLSFDTCAAKHASGAGVPEVSLSWRITEAGTGATIVLSGDTSYNPDLSQFASGVHAIIHDAAHSTGGEAAHVARAAQVDSLFLIHYDRQHAQRVLEEARRVFAETYLAEAGQRISV